MGKFRAPKPEPYETFDAFVGRWTHAFDQWVNERFEPGPQPDPTATVTLRPFDINNCVQTADDMRELLRAALESGDTGHVLRVVRDLASGCDG
ncbi:MAG: hypothetical protein AB7E24_23960 [Novosphingobium sp.]